MTEELMNVGILDPVLENIFKHSYTPIEALTKITNLPLISKKMAAIMNTNHVKDMIRSLLNNYFYVSFFTLKNLSPLFKEVIFPEENFLNIFGWKEFIIADTGQNFIVVYSGTESWDLFGMNIIEMPKRTEDYLVLRTTKEITIYYKDFDEKIVYKFPSYYSIRTLIQQEDQLLLIVDVSDIDTVVFHASEYLIMLNVLEDVAYGRKGYYSDGKIRSYWDDEVLDKYPSNLEYTSITPLWRDLDQLENEAINSELRYRPFDPNTGKIYPFNNNKTFEWMWYDDNSVFDLVEGREIFTAIPGFRIFGISRDPDSISYFVYCFEK